MSKYSCCISGCCHKQPTKRKAFLKGLHNCCTLSCKILASAIIISLTFWLLLREIEPSAYVNKFELEAFKNESSHLAHFDITIHNPDLYKSIFYESLLIRFHFEPLAGRTGVTVNYPVHEQGPGKSWEFGNSTVDAGSAWATWLQYMRDGKYPFNLKLMMMVKYKLFNTAIASRQITRIASVYFDGSGTAFIDSRRKLRFK